MKDLLKYIVKMLSFLNTKFTMVWLLLLFFGNTVFAKKSAVAQQTIIITNPASLPRINEIITVKKTAFKNAGAGLFPLVKNKNNILITQKIDTNNDGSWDQLLIEVSLAPHATANLQISWPELAATSFQKFTNVQLSLRSTTSMASPEINQAIRYRGFKQNIARPFYQLEGPGIENDKVAFRAFFDYRNGKDIYGKIVDGPILEKVGVGASWHEMQTWGKDILKVGNSLGAGALAVEENKKIYPLADADTTSFQNLYEGALQASFQLSFKNWDVANHKQNGSESISITKGNFYYKNNITLSLGNHQKFLAGMAHFISDSLVYKKHNAEFSSVSTYGKQADGTTTNLGLAIMFATGSYVANAITDTASVIPNTAYVALKPSNKKAIYFFACWEKTDQRFATQNGFEGYLQETANKLANPIKIKIINKK